MLPWIIQMSVISLLLIMLIHYLFIYFKTNLTIPKVKDLVNKPQQQYDKIFDTMNHAVTYDNKADSDDNMKNELKNYLKELNNKKPEKSVPPVNNMDGLMTLDTMGSGAYSSF
jgi:hypothetical protein